MIPYNPQGLTPEEVAASRAAHGENIITPQRDDSAWRLLAEKFRDPIIIVLLVAAALSLAMAFMEGNFTETIGILCAILLATCVGFLFEWDAMRRFRRLNRVNDEQPVKVRRGGVMREIPRREVVVGDLVSLEAGETVPADGELVEAVSLQMDESTLTGEPETAKYVDEELFDPEATYPSNRLLRGTTVRDGYGRMVVTAVGDATEAGRVTEQATVQSGEQTPLHRQLTRLSRQIGKVGIALSVLIFVILIGKAFLVEGLADAPWPHVVRIVLNCFMVSVAMIVMAVPEGLPMSITLSLALSMRRMLKTNNLVRKMHACETMGAVTVICTDKTGTLTEATPEVTRVIAFGDWSRCEVLRLSACLEEHFPHPVARAVVRAAEARNLKHREKHSEVEYIVAHGIASSLEGKRVVIGSEHFVVEDEGVLIEEEKRERISRETEGLSPLYLAVDGELVGVIGIEDPIKPNVPTVLPKVSPPTTTHSRNLYFVEALRPVSVALLAPGSVVTATRCPSSDVVVP